MAGGELRRRDRVVLEQRLVRHDQHRPVEARGLDELEVARVGHYRARLHGLHAGAQVGRAELLGARLRATAPSRQQASMA